MKHIRKVMDKTSKIFIEKVDENNIKPFDEITEIYNKEKDYIESKFDNKGMLDHFHEYMVINEYKHSHGDTLNFKDFINPGIIEFKNGGLPNIL